MKAFTATLMILLSALLTSTLVACGASSGTNESISSVPGGADPLGTAAVNEAQARASKQQMERIAKATEQARASEAKATQDANSVIARATAMAQEAQATRLAMEIRATDQAIASEATTQALQATRISQEAQATQAAISVEVHRKNMESEANATATATVRLQQLEVARAEAEQVKQRNEVIWQAILIGVAAIFGTVLLVFVILSVRPAIVKMWDSFMKSRISLARIQAGAQNPVQIVETQEVSSLPVIPTNPFPSAQVGKTMVRFGNEDIRTKWDAQDTRPSPGLLDATNSVVIEQDAQ